MSERELLNEICRVFRILGSLFAYKALKAISKAGSDGVSLSCWKQRLGVEEEFLNRLVIGFLSAGLVEEVKDGKNKKRFRITDLGRFFSDDLPIVVHEIKNRRI